MNRWIITVGLCGLSLFSGCKDRAKDGQAKTDSAPVQSPAAPAQPAGHPSTPAPAASAAATAGQFYGKWQQVDGEEAGFTVSLNKDGSFFTEHDLKWKKLEDFPYVQMKGKWSVAAGHITFDNIQAWLYRAGQAEPSACFASPTTAPTKSALLPATSPPDMPPAKTRNLRPGLAGTIADRETDKILSIDQSSFKTLDEDGVTRSYKRIE